MTDLDRTLANEDDIRKVQIMAPEGVSHHATYDWTPLREWQCPRCLTSMLTRSPGPRCPKCGAMEDE